MPGSARVTAFAGLGTVLASVVLISVIQGGNWFWQACGAVTLVGLVGVGGRHLGVLRPLTAVGQLVALIGYLTFLFVPGPAVAGVYPGPAAIDAVNRLLVSGVADIRNSAAPVVPSPGVALITVAGIGFMALLVDLIGVAYRRTALAGLPLLALYTVPASVLPDGVNGLLFVFPAAGFLGILLAEGRERVMRWGQPVVASVALGRRGAVAPGGGGPGGGPRGGGGPGSTSDGVTVSVGATELNQLGRRIGMAAVGLAIVVPAFLPGLSEGVFIGGGGGGEGAGSSRTIATLNALVSLRRDLTRPEDVEVLRARTDTPALADLYFRTVTLDVFDGQDWRASNRRVRRFDQELPPAHGLTSAIPSRAIRTTVEVTDRFASDYLPLPYPARRVAIDGEWRVDEETQNVVSQRGRRQITGREYRVESLMLSPTREQLLGGGSEAADPSLSRYLRLPRLPQVVEDQARQITRNADTPLDRALAIQSWLRDPDNFTYDLEVGSGTGTSAILEFLRNRRGYCEQFASTMAVMARTVGIPARVNVGFTSGDVQEDGSLVVSSHDAHAWPELYFPNVGWTRFEPTPPAASAGPTVPSWLAAATPTAPDAATAPTDSPGTASPSPSPGAALDCVGADRGRPQCREFANPLGVPEPQNPATPWVLLVAGLVLLIALVPAVLRVAVRHRRWSRARDWRRRAEAAWAQLRDDAYDLGHGWTETETPRQYAGRIRQEGKVSGEAAQALARISRAVELARYAPASSGWGASPAHGHVQRERSGGEGPTPTPGDVRQVRSALAAATGWRARTRAWLFPASSLRMLGRLGGRMVDVVDSFEERISRLRSRLLPVRR
jgi:transglutaminase-like putative cysteine protease